MTDHIYASFLEDQNRALESLCARSRALRFEPIQTDPALPANLFIVSMMCAHAVLESGHVEISRGSCDFGIALPHDYLRRVYPDSAGILSLIEPRGCYHPNVRWPHICCGPITPGTPVVQLVMRVNEILTYNRFTPREDDCLNREACQWARARMSRFPLERRPLIDDGPAADASATGLAKENNR